MTATEIILLLLKVTGAVVIFIYGMKMMSEGLQKMAGNRMRSILGRMTNNPVSGILTGLSQTAIDLADGYVKIPMYGFTESFNISVSAALCTFYLTEKMRSTTGLDWRLSPDEQMDVKLCWARQSIRDAVRLMRKLAADLELPEILI